jgi:hypothetical protein
MELFQPTQAATHPLALIRTANAASGFKMGFSRVTFSGSQTGRDPNGMRRIVVDRPSARQGIITCPIAGFATPRACC